MGGGARSGAGALEGWGGYGLDWIGLDWIGTGLVWLIDTGEGEEKRGVSLD